MRPPVANGAGNGARTGRGNGHAPHAEPDAVAATEGAAVAGPEPVAVPAPPAAGRPETGRRGRRPRGPRRPTRRHDPPPARHGAHRDRTKPGGAASEGGMVEDQLADWLEEGYVASFRTACLILGNRADAEEAVQDAYLRAWRFRDSLSAVPSIRPWLYRVVVNSCYSKLRQRDPPPRPPRR